METDDNVVGKNTSRILMRKKKCSHESFVKFFLLCYFFIFLKLKIYTNKEDKVEISGGITHAISIHLEQKWMDFLFFFLFYFIRKIFSR